MTATAPSDGTDVVDPADRRRWITLGVVVSAVLIVALDTTVLNVAIPTIVEEFHTDLASVQWVVAGYSLTFATLLVIGGRLADLFGARRIFITGTSLFFAGSGLASVSHSVPVLVLGEAVIEGVGAALMMPSTLSILSTMFTGPERATAFSMWGSASGTAVALGPLIGGYFTTYHSWRWSFRINLVVAPVAIIGALLFMPRLPPDRDRPKLDLVGAALVASGLFLLVFGLSEGRRFGWLRCAPAFVAAAVFLWAFVTVELRKERAGDGPLLAFGQLRHLGFRYGLLTTSMVALGQLGFLFSFSVFLQDHKHLDAQENGLWLLPWGLAIVAGAQIGGRLARRIGPTMVVRIGLAAEVVGLAALTVLVDPSVTLLTLLAPLLAYGLGMGFASSQLSNVVLSDVDPDYAGSVSGVNSTMRQVGAALGVAVVGAMATRPALGFVTVVIGLGALTSLAIPVIKVPAARIAAPPAGEAAV